MINANAEEIIKKQNVRATRLIEEAKKRITSEIQKETELLLSGGPKKEVLPDLVFITPQCMYPKKKK